MCSRSKYIFVFLVDNMLLGPRLSGLHQWHNLDQVLLDMLKGHKRKYFVDNNHNHHKYLKLRFYKHLIISLELTWCKNFSNNAHVRCEIWF